MARLLKDKLPPLNPEENIIGKKIAQTRREKGLTQKQLAEKIGIKRALLSDYELGRVRVYAEMLARIALALNVSADEILGITNNLKRQLPSLRLMKRLHEIEKLSPSQQKALLKNIDMFVKAAKKEN